MRDVTIARNYAETLFELASRAEGVEGWGELLDATAAAMQAPKVESMLMSPRVHRDEKVRIVSDALREAPRPFVLFLVALIRRGRQYLIGTIADEYRVLADDKLGRVRASITLARDADPLTRQVISERLARAIGKDVIAGFVTDPAILGGTIVRIGDQVHDGSVRKRLGRLRRQLLG
ncbi:MAG: ATP synthase F1 subunit delta [Gemmatimonadales bacterium]|nr:ATP synthase F1 subunit delta [Gemmatimonadales bacterium]